jgi:putative transposase
METDKDHIHMLIDCSPQQQIPSIIKALKGVSARLLLKEHPEIRKSLRGGHLWNPSYFIATASENTEEWIRNYIRNQKGE